MSNKRIKKKHQKIYWGKCSAEHLRKMKMRVFRKRNKIDRQAVEIAKKIHYAPYFCSSDDTNKTIKVNTYSLWEKYISTGVFDEDEFWEMKCMLSAIRKAIVDGFPIENTFPNIKFANGEQVQGGHYGH